MPAVSINILTKNRVDLLKEALQSVARQNFSDYEVIIIDDGSTDSTEEQLKNLPFSEFKVIRHEKSLGIIASRQEALETSRGEFVAVLDDDDVWVDTDKLKKQLEYFFAHPKCVLVGGGRMVFDPKKDTNKGHLPYITRPENDADIRRSMLFRNNFFTSTVMFKRQAAVQAGGFITDGIDVAEDYDLWLRLGKIGEMYNFQEVFDKYRLPSYNKDTIRKFYTKQAALIRKQKMYYPYYFFALLFIKIRIYFSYYGG